MNYYNEIDPFAAQWLRNLIEAGEIPKGEVDERSIADVRPEDLDGFAQCHFFAGIGGWSYALNLAGWPEDRPVWTGSCPCQPFSLAGQQRGTADERHLWPEWFRLIRECRPRVLFGEQVSSAIRHGWLDIVSDDLEGEDYSIGPIVLPACGVGAPHIRQRLWFVAEPQGERLNGCLNSARERRRAGIEDRGGLVLAERSGLEGLARPGFGGNKPGRLAPEADGPIAAAGSNRGVAISNGERRDRENLSEGREGSRTATFQRGANPWSSIDWIPCADGKARPIKPGLEPVAPRLPGHVGKLRSYGNSIVPQAAAEVIRAYMGSPAPPTEVEA